MVKIMCQEAMSLSMVRGLEANFYLPREVIGWGHDVGFSELFLFVKTLLASMLGNGLSKVTRV